MKNEIYYEWIVETFAPGTDPMDPENDIVDTSAFDSIDEAWRFLKACDEPARLGLTRNVGNAEEGIIDRSWAYCDERLQLPAKFEYVWGERDGPLVPSHYRNLAQQE